ncbi:MAG: hypothetical protein IJ294_04545, partial [Clostridia bacterium]|nr:hypothetical protein [Clostridia bacterium]
TAYYIASTYDVSLQEAFLFVGEFVNDRDEDDIEFDKEMGQEQPTTIWKNGKERLISHIKSVAADPEVRCVFFDIVGSLAWTYRVIEKFHNAGELDVTTVDRDVLEICADDDITVSYCKEAVKYYKDHATDQHGEEAFEEYIDSILCNIPMETAFDMIIRLNDVIEYNSPYCAAFQESDIVDNFTDFSESTDEYTEMYYDYNDEDRI